MRGKALAEGAHIAQQRDHPRVCGEKHAWASFRFAQLGSPPRMRGKEVLAALENKEDRITPAYAGKRLGSFLRSGLCWDHPRVCGEKFKKDAKTSTERGSPPRMRGKGCITFCSPHVKRITPAYAGKRRREDGATFRLEDHPRVCGEKSSVIALPGRQPGSPPRMRGKVCGKVVESVESGITPAYAGKSHCMA